MANPTGTLNADEDHSTRKIANVAHPPVADYDAATKKYVDDNISGGVSGSQIISGGGVAWTGTGLNFVVSAAVYQINGFQYNSPQTTITLAAADPSNDRIDVFAVTTSGTAVVITGTPGGPPLEPQVDPTAQLKLTTATVPAASSTPLITNQNLYLENTEWTSTATGGTINLASTNNPFAGTKDIEGTATVAGNGFLLTKPSGTLLLSDYGSLVLQLRSKASWPGPKSMVFIWQNGAVNVGATATIKQGAFGFDSSITTNYQQIVIPINVFNTGSNPVNKLVLQVVGGGSAIGWYIDNIILQTISNAGTGAGDFSTNTNVSVANEVVLFANTTGKLGKRATGTGITDITNGQLGTIIIGSGLSFAGHTLSSTGGGSGTVTSFSSSNLSPLFSTSVATPTTTPALSFTLSTAAANSWYGNSTGGTAAPAFNTSVLPAVLMPGYTGDVTSSAGATVNTIGAGKVTYAKIQNVSANSILLGSSATGSGAPPSEIALGTNLSISGSTLNATGGVGTVTNTGGNLTANSVVLGAGTADTKVVAGVITDGTSKLTLGVSTTSVGSIALNNLTSGAVTIQPATGALSTATMTIPAGSTNPVVADTGAADNFLTAISSAGVISKAQPSFSNLSGNFTLAQGPSETLSTLLGRGSAAGNGVPQEITLGTNISMSGTTLNATGGGSAVGGSITGHGDSNYTILSTDKIVATNAAFTTVRTWTMPAANTVTAGNSISIIDLQGTLTAANRIAIARNGTDVFWPGSNTQINLTQAGQGIQFTSDGVSKWYVTYHTPATPVGNVMLWDNGSKAWNVGPIGLNFALASASAGNIVRSDGTNWVSSGLSFPNAGTTGKVIIGNGSAYVESTPTWPTAAGSSGVIVQSNGTNLITSTPTWPTTAGTAGYTVRTDGTNYSAYPQDILASSVATVSASYAADTYLAGSAVTVAAGDFKAQGQYYCMFDMVKTGAGVATPIIIVRVGTAGTTADTAILTFTFGAGTAVADTAAFEIWATFRTVGSGTSAIMVGACTGTHQLATTGMFNNAASWPITGVVSSGFATNAATKIGVSFNGGSSFSGTNTLVQAQLLQ